MKSIKPKWRDHSHNAWGQYSPSDRENFEVEEADVGTTRPNHGGRRMPGYQFKPSDVGRKIQAIDNFACWYFMPE